MTTLTNICNDTSTDTTVAPSVDNTLVQYPPLHIVLVTETWAPDVNGVAMSLYQLMNELVNLGHKVSLIRPKPTSQPSDKNNASTSNLKNHIKITHRITQVKFEEVQVKGLPIPRYSNLQFGVPAYYHIKRSLEQFAPDIVHIATEGPLGLAALLAAKRDKIPVTTGYHTQFHDFSKHFGMGLIAKPLLAYFKWFHNWSDATCVPSQKTELELTSLGFKRIKQVGRGVDTQRFHPTRRSHTLRESWGALQQHTVLIMVSRLSPEKGVSLVIKSFTALQSTQIHRATKLVIVGDGPDRSRLEALAASSGDDIIFTGAKTGIELAEHYASGDAFVFASQVETFGNVVTEAMASGLPVFAFDDAAAGMLITQATGGLAPVGNSIAFVDMIAKLPKMQTLHQQGLQAQKTVSGFSWQRPALQMLQMFMNAIETHCKTNKNAKTKKIMIDSLNVETANL